MFAHQYSLARTIWRLASLALVAGISTTSLSHANEASAIVAPLSASTLPTDGSSKTSSLVLSASDTPLQTNKTRHLKATLNGKAVTGIMWSVDGSIAGDARQGAINKEGLYTAPATLPPKNPVTILASVSSNGKTLTSSKQLLIHLPKPHINNVAPRAFKPGPYELTINGSQFLPGAKLFVNGKEVPAQLVSDKQITTKGTAQELGVLELLVMNQGKINSATYKKVAVTADGKPLPNPEPSPTPTPTPPPTPTPAPAPDLKKIAAARFLEQASFGPVAADMNAVMQSGPQAWINAQIALPASSMASSTNMASFRNTWFTNMASGPDQLRQRMIFALSQLFVVSADKNNDLLEMKPWFDSLSRHAFGNYEDLLREMTLNPSMGRYLDMANSVTPAPNENYAREVMQLFSIGTQELNMDGSLKLDSSGAPISTYNQARIGDFSRALSGWTYPGKNATGLNWNDFSGPLQARDRFHDKKAKTLLMGTELPANQTTVQDYDAVMRNLFHHPNVPPFIATRLIRHFVSSNPSPAYIERVATVFANGTSANGGKRGDLAATLSAVLLDPEARQDIPTSTQGHLKDPILQTLGLVRVLDGKIIDPTNLFWDYFLMGQKLANSPSVFNFYSPLTRLPTNPQYFGPEFQIYAPSLAIARANFIYRLLQGSAKTSVQIDITPYVNIASDPNALINLVDANLLHGRMSATTRSAIFEAVVAISDKREKALTALYLSAISADFAVHQ